MKLFREPFVHFLIAGSLLFGGYEWLNRGNPSSDVVEPVRIGKGELHWLSETFASQWRRKPTADELDDLLTTLVSEELLAREARSLGLDRDDTIVRRRLAQKLSFLVEDTSRIAEPSEDELRRYYTAHSVLYRTGKRISFRHAFFSQQHRPDADGDARLALVAAMARGGAEAAIPAGDPLLVNDTFTDVDAQAVSSLFGPDFARGLFDLPSGTWAGPITSAYGVHLVEVTQTREATLQRFEDVHQAVTEDWRRQKNMDAKEAYLARLREKYGVVIEAPAASGSATQPGPKFATP